MEELRSKITDILLDGDNENAAFWAPEMADQILSLIGRTESGAEVPCNGGLNVQANEPYSRREDMTTEGKLTVIMQEDGDMIVTVYGESLSPDRMHSASVEFCSPWVGGGRSRHTRKALQDLAIAIQKDNLERAI